VSAAVRDFESFFWRESYGAESAVDFPPFSFQQVETGNTHGMPGKNVSQPEPTDK
jgi:hypothetical protein